MLACLAMTPGYTLLGFAIHASDRTMRSYLADHFLQKGEDSQVLVCMPILASSHHLAQLWTMSYGTYITRRSFHASVIQDNANRPTMSAWRGAMACNSGVQYVALAWTGPPPLATLATVPPRSVAIVALTDEFLPRGRRVREKEAFRTKPHLKRFGSRTAFPRNITGVDISIARYQL